MKTNVTVYVIDDDPDMRRSLAWLFAPTGLGIESFECVDDFLATYDNRPGCIILDINLPGMSGLDFAHALPTYRIDLPVIIITGKADIPTAVHAMKTGAIDFVPKPFDGSQLITIVREAIDNRLSLRQERRKGEGNAGPRDFRLTPREREVMRLLVDGKANKEIAQILDIGVRTVETYRSEIMRKFNLKSLADLVKLVIGGGIP